MFVLYRQELTNAEKLFDLPITTYPNLVRVQTEMRGLEQIYALYEEQKNAREEWAQTLWANLNVNLVRFDSVKQSKGVNKCTGINSSSNHKRVVEAIEMCIYDVHC